jgi:hypothetical protein
MLISANKVDKIYKKRLVRERKKIKKIIIREINWKLKNVTPSEGNYGNSVIDIMLGSIAFKHCILLPDRIMKELFEEEIIPKLIHKGFEVKKKYPDMDDEYSYRIYWKEF